MTKRLSIIFAFMLIFQTFVSGISPAFVKAEGSDVNFTIVDVSVGETNEDGEAEVTATWSANGEALADGATATANVSLDDKFTEAEGSGDLTADGSSVGTYAVDANGNVS